MIGPPSGVRVWLATGRTDMRRGMNGLALQVQQAPGRDRHACDVYVLRGKRGDLLKVLWHDGLGMSLYAKRLERGRKLLDQLELELEEAETAASEADTQQPDTDTTVRPFSRRKPVRGPLPTHLPRERVVVPGPSACPCCGGALAKLGETIIETLEVIPRRWKVIQTVCEKSSYRACETITQPPAPFRPIARGRAGPAAAGRDPGGEVRPAPAAEPPRRGIRAGRDRPRRLDAGPVGGTDPFGGPAPPAALFHYAADRGGEHPKRHLPGWSGILQADAYAGFNDLYAPTRLPGPVSGAACWAYGRWKFFALAEPGKAPLAVEAVRRIDAIFEIEREINRVSSAQRLAVRQEQAVSHVDDLGRWMRGERDRLSRYSEVAKALDYMLKRWAAFRGFVDDGRICMTNNAAERSLRGVVIGRKTWLFAGSDRGGEGAAAMYSLMVIAKLNGVDPQAWLANVLARTADHPLRRLEELLPWNRRPAYHTAERTIGEWIRMDSRHGDRCQAPEITEQTIA